MKLKALKILGKKKICKRKFLIRETISRENFILEKLLYILMGRKYFV